MKQKLDLEKEKKDLVETAAGKEQLLKKKISTIGNLVHESVPVYKSEAGFVLNNKRLKYY